jgi:transposase
VIKVRRIDYGDGNKKFSQLRYENGEWIYGLNEDVTKRVRLYRIAEARALSEKTGHPIFMVEGESCVERLMAIGIPATTSLGGSGKWTGYGYPNYLQDLQGCRVVLAPDGDAPGLKHMKDIASSLRQHGIEIAGWLLAPPDAPWENLPDGGGLDVVDWLDSGATAEDILRSVRTTLPDYLARDHEQQAETIDKDEEATARFGLPGRNSLANVLVELALEMGSLWHDSTGEAWIDFTEGEYMQTARVKSKRFQDFLRRILWKRHHRTINSEGWSQAIGTLEALAQDKDAPEREAFLRVAQHEGSIYIDLATKDWRIVRVSPNGWEIIPYADCPVRFYRADCQLPLPIPERGGSLDGLWQLLNFKEADRPLVLGWILGCLTPNGPKPILVLSGEKGAGKSSAATLLKRLTDPTRVSKAGEVGDERQVAASARGRWVLAFDNLTHLSTNQQNLLCRVVTGEGFTHRTLYTDLEETFFEYHRPQILTGVDLVPTRGDLLDRCLIVRLERIPDERRLPEAELGKLTDKLLPGIYGALLDLLATALRNLPTIKLDRRPRMADFFELCVAAGIPNFESAYAGNIEVGCQAAVEANPIAEGIVSLLDAHNGYWHGSSTELIRRLQELDPTNREFQKLSARSIGRKLSSSLKGDLKAVGIEVDQGRGTNGQRYLILSRIANSRPTAPQASASGQGGSEAKDQTSPGPTPTQNKGSMGGTTVSAPDPTTFASALRSDENTNVRSRTGSPGSHPEQKKSTNSVPQVESGSLTPRAGSSNSRPAGNVSSSPEVHNAGANGQQVRTPDRETASLPPRGREGRLAQIAEQGDNGNQSRVEKGSPIPDRASGTESLSKKQAPPPTSPPPVDGNAYITKQDWDALVAACKEAGMLWIPSLKFIAEAVGIPVEKLDPFQMTQRQYQQAMRRVEEYRRSAEQERWRSEALERLEIERFER